MTRETGPALELGPGTGPLTRALLDRLDLEITRVGHSFHNGPPATVYRVAKIKTLSADDWRFA